MFTIKLIKFRQGNPNLTFSILKNFYSLKPNFQQTDNKLNDLLKKYESKIIYSSLINENQYKFSYKTNQLIQQRLAKNQRIIQEKLETIQPLPLSLKYLSSVHESSSEGKINNHEVCGQLSSNQSELNRDLTQTNEGTCTIIRNDHKENSEEIKEEISGRWMTAYDNFNDSLITDSNNERSWDINYGTPDPTSSISRVPCGGCGAFLHCKDKSIPGYIPSEIYKNVKKNGSANLQALICQRCHFLKHYNLALNTNVTAEEYPKILQTIQSKKSLMVVLMIDLLDFPCSIWPGIADIFNYNIPIVVVGNKVDLLPKDNSKYLQHIKNVLLDNVRLAGFGTKNIKHVALISAKTGYGIEDLITNLWSLFKTKGDVYVVGCTNVGKSSLFNKLLQSDYCKKDAADLIQRATISIWPGTTLNLLKFPIKRPSGFGQFLRAKRLEVAQKMLKEENAERLELLRLTKDPKLAELVGHVDRTQRKIDKDLDETKDYFQVKGHSNDSGKLRMGIDETTEQYNRSKWCYDTPGVVQPDQITNLLTTDELLTLLPNELILPRTFLLKPGMTLFLAGLARLDFIEGPNYLLFTTFSSNQLPITICRTEDADELYSNLLEVELYFKVPVADRDRLRNWPGLESSKLLRIRGVNREKSCNDIVLSSAGWIALTGEENCEYTLQAWTPEKRGVYLREALLPYVVSLRGRRIKNTVAYKKHRFFLE